MPLHLAHDTPNATIATSRDGTRIYADAVGDPSNPAVVFVHGFTLCAAVFDKIFRNSLLLHKLYMVRYDIRGHGRSERPDSEDRYTSKCFAEDFAAVCDVFRLQRPFFAGWSLGASVLTDIATHFPPSFLRGAIYLSALPATGSTISEVATAEVLPLVPGILSANDTALSFNSRKQFFDMFFNDPTSVSFEMQCAWLGMMGFSLPWSATWTLERVQEREKLFELGQGGRGRDNDVGIRGDAVSADNGGSSSTDRSEHNDTSKWRPLPLLLIHGTNDKVINGESVIKLISPHFKDLEVHELRGCGHVPHYERTEEVAMHITDFVRRTLELEHGTTCQYPMLLSGSRVLKLAVHYLVPSSIKKFVAPAMHNG